MAFNTKLAHEVRTYLSGFTHLDIKEKQMFGGLAFMINEKMCVNVSKDRLMCRFNPKREEEIVEKIGYEPMVMNGKELRGFCYVDADAIVSATDLEFWVDLCLDFNKEAKKSKP